MATIEQAKANKENAKLSTGPRTSTGKQVVSGNRITHGILSTQLLLADESAEEYQTLLDDLQHQLRPVGTLELALVDRIAVSLWRQRRLVKAETASITLKLTQVGIAETVSEGMGRSKYSDQAIKPRDLEPPDQELMEWCAAVIPECEGAAGLNLSDLQEATPLLFKQLTEDAVSAQMPVAEYLSEEGALAVYVRKLAAWCGKELEKVDRYERITQLTGTAVDKLSIPWGKLDIFTKYQTSLDNQTYKAMKALREAQEWRLKTIEAEPALEAEGEVEAA
ncbi:MAG: hypothetical protein ABFS45_22465 [Pseudomonadota bacterium]